MMFHLVFSFPNVASFSVTCPTDIFDLIAGSQEDLEEQMSDMNIRQNGAQATRYNYR